MSSPPDINPYIVLGIQKDATLPEIKTAHRKLVLKCHPDKIQDESQRNRAQDEFQQVQQAYELLSDPARRIKYDQKARLAELRRERMERSADSTPYSSPRASSSNTTWECRDGRIYEERTPADAKFFDEESRYTDEPRPMSRKHDDLGRRRTKGADEKRSSKTTPLNSFLAAKEMARDHAKATHSYRAKNRTRERKREAYEKYERAAPYYDLSDDGSDSSTTPYYAPPRRGSASESRRRTESSSRRTRPKESSRRRDFRDYDDDEYSDEWESKHDYLHTSARDYILRSRGSVPIEVDSRQRASQSPMRHRGYESSGPDSSARRSGRSTRSSKDTARSSNSQRGSYEHLDSPRTHEPKVPSMPAAATSMGVKVPPSVRPPQFSRAATSGSVYSRAKRESSSRPESTLENMVYNDSVPPRFSKRRDRYDSGYSSPNTPEIPTSPPKTTCYKIVTEPETILVEPDKPSSRRQRASSPPRQERPPLSRTASKPVRGSPAYGYPSDSSARYETKPPSASRTSSSRRLFGEVEYSPRPKSKDIKYAREIGPEDIRYTHDIYPRHYDDYRPPVSRRQTTYA